MSRPDASASPAEILTQIAESTTLRVLNAAFRAQGPDDFTIVELHVTWEVRIGDPVPSVRIYRFDTTGQFVQMEEMLNGIPRHVVPRAQAIESSGVRR
jgi:hypothetical protein